MDIKIAPSILSADFGKLNEEIASVEDHADYMHVDVMDGHFVPNLTFGPPVIKYIKSKRPLDVHLMIDNPQKYIEEYVKAGADILTVHYEAVENLREIISKIKSLGVKAGVSIKPKTKVEVLKEILPELDWVLIMSVEPGFGGQEFMSSALDKIKYIREMSPEIDIAVDGGINETTGKKCVGAGANILIAGSYIFKAQNRIEAINTLKGFEGYSGA